MSLMKMKQRIAIVCAKGAVEGRIQVAHGRLGSMRWVSGKGKVAGNRIQLKDGTPGRLEIGFDKATCQPGPEATLVTVDVKPHAFSFLLRDVSAEYPIYLPDYGVAVTRADDRRTFADIAAAVTGSGRQTQTEKVAQAPETDFETAAAQTRNLRCPTMLGLSRDIRLFGVDFPGKEETVISIRPQLHSYTTMIPDTNYKHEFYDLTLTRGISCVADITRWMEDRCLPILHLQWRDETVVYHGTMFCGLEKALLSARAVCGTDYLVADGFGSGHMFTPEQAHEFKLRLAAETSRTADETLGYFRAMKRGDGSRADGHGFTKDDEESFKKRYARTAHAPEETVLFMRIEAVNTDSVPRYAWFKTVRSSVGPCQFERKTGLSVFGYGQAYALSRMNGRPLNNEEIAVLLKPGETATLEINLFHRPVSRARALRLMRIPFEVRRQACRSFWQAKLDKGAQIELPESRITEMIKAGLLHLDLFTFGREPRGAVTPTVGRYSAIGTESAPIIQFFDSMGHHELARRALEYFLEKQHTDGFMQNYGRYTSETGPVLWSLGEHYRYTRDDRWARRVAPKVLKACDYLIQWRRRNQCNELKARGYGMLEGKMADDDHPFRSFCLNGYSCLGLFRSAELLTGIRPKESQRIKNEAERFRKNIRDSLRQALARGPVVPLGNGQWCPTSAPWTEDRGLLALYTEPKLWNSHGGFITNDSLVGPLWLIFQEILAPDELMAEQLLAYNADMLFPHLVGMSQPYYSRHPEIFLMRGEVNAFLKAYYFGFTALADRETYTFWEHYQGGSPHKTHEEAWFLMQTRRMLWQEQGTTLCLLPGIPRAWLRDGQSIRLKHVASYFGPFSLTVESHVDQGRVKAMVQWESERRPSNLTIRIPHPTGQHARRVTGGVYDSSHERIRLSTVKKRNEIQVYF